MARSTLPSSAPAGLGPINIATPGLSPGAKLCRASGAPCGFRSASFALA